MDYNYNETPLIVPSSHSIQADMATGWKPKLKIIGPMPLNFDNVNIDKAIKSIVNSETSFYSVAYLGPRPTNTFQMHEIYAKKYRYKYIHLVHGDFAHLKSFFHKFYRQFEPATKRQFMGMNPAIKKHNVEFDSAFQSGNLDCAIKVRQDEYDLILRIDSNTAGHIMWYYFKVSNKENKEKVIKFSIVNLRRRMKSAYERGMKPFVKRKHQAWKQEGQNVEVSEERLRYNKESLLFSTINENYEVNQSIFRKLSFQIKFDALEQIQIAYCIPYTYSEMLNDIKSIRKQLLLQKSSTTFDCDFSNESLSGLQIPIIKISEETDQVPDNKKYCIFIIGRQHPGQSNGSFVMKGILQKLIQKSEQWKKIRENCVFMVIPMLNPDGVVIGNFRTSLYGKDLNRLFKSQDVSLIPEIDFSRNLLFQVSKNHKNKFLIFLDIHGHSTRRNSFVFGPGILDANILSDIRYFPKIIASKTQIFRYPSCSFRINNDKKTTARALFTKYAGLSYTVQSSNWSYYSQKEGAMLDFDESKWHQVGIALSLSIQDYIFQKLKAKKHKNKGKKNQSVDIRKNDKLNRIYANKSKKINKSISINEQTLKARQSKDIKLKTQKQLGKSIQKNKTQISTSPIKQNIRFNKFAEIQQKEEQNESDKMSSDGMDTDSEGQDMEKQKFKNYIHSASKMIIEFQKAYYGDNYKKQKQLQREKNQLQNKNKKFLFKEKKKIQVLACLRKKQPTSQQLIQEGFVRKMKLEKKPNFVESIPIEKSQKNGVKESIWTIDYGQNYRDSKIQTKIQTKAESSHLLSTGKVAKKQSEMNKMDKKTNYSQQFNKNTSIASSRQIRFDFGQSKINLQDIKESLNFDRYNFLRSPDETRANMSKVYELIGRQSSSRRRTQSKKQLQAEQKKKMHQNSKPLVEPFKSSISIQPKQIQMKEYIPTFPKIIRPLQNAFDYDGINFQKPLSNSCKNINEETIKVIRTSKINDPNSIFSQKVNEIIQIENEINKSAHSSVYQQRGSAKKQQ